MRHCYGRTAAALAAAILVAAVARPQKACAQEATPQRSFGLLVHGGSYAGFGAGAVLGSRALGVRASVGWAPLLVVVSGARSELDFYGALLVSPDLYVRLFSVQDRTDVGLLAGYRYSSLLGHGGAAGGYVQFGVARALDLFVSLGVLFFPEGDDRLRREQNLPQSTQFSFPGPQVSLGLGFGLAFYP